MSSSGRLTAVALPEVRTASQDEVQRIYDEAHAAGYRDGLSAADDQVRSLAGAFDEAHRNYDALTRGLAARLRHEAVELAILLGQALTVDHLDHSPESIERALAEAIQPLADADLVTVSANPEDISLLARFGDQSRVHLTADSALERGSLALRSAIGDIDATMPNRVRRAVHALRPADDSDDA
jgi:flagellar biosynthesis/type III secretory pathway protein FliH